MGWGSWLSGDRWSWKSKFLAPRPGLHPTPAKVHWWHWWGGDDAILGDDGELFEGMLMILEMLSFHHNGKSFVLNLEVKGASGFGNLNVANTIVWLVQGRNSDRAHYWILKSYLPLQNKNCMNCCKMKTTTYQRCRMDQGCCPRRIQAEKSPRQADQAYEIKFGLQGFAFV